MAPRGRPRTKTLVPHYQIIVHYYLPRTQYQPTCTQCGWHGNKMFGTKDEASRSARTTHYGCPKEA